MIGRGTPAADPAGRGGAPRPATPERVLEVDCGDGDGGALPRPRVPARPGARRRPLRRGGPRAAGARVGLDPEGRVAFKQGGPRRPALPRRLLRPRRPARRPPGGRRVARVLRPGGLPRPRPQPGAGRASALRRPAAALAARASTASSRSGAAAPATAASLVGRLARRAERAALGADIGCRARWRSTGCRWRCWSTRPRRGGRR